MRDAAGVRDAHQLLAERSGGRGAVCLAFFFFSKSPPDFGHGSNLVLIVVVVDPFSIFYECGHLILERLRSWIGAFH